MILASNALDEQQILSGQVNTGGVRAEATG
jgi:hypothetical protein